MSHIDQNLPNPMDRLGLLLDHAVAMATAGTGEDFGTMNPRAIGNFNDALLHILIDASAAFEELLTLRMAEAKATEARIQ